MEINKLFNNDSIENMADNVFGSVNNAVSEVREMQRKKVAENVQLIVQALKKIEQDIYEKYDFIGGNLEKRILNIKDGKDGINGRDGRDGKDGKQGKDGRPGRDGKDGKNGLDGQNGEDGVSVVNAHIDFDGSLIITLSSGKEINVGEVVASDIAEKIKVITNGGGTSQSVLDTLDSLQAQITALDGFLDYKGTWNASTNSPTLVSSTGTKGDYYVVSVAGSTTLNGESNWGVGDWVVFNNSTWQKVDGGSTGNFITVSASTSVTTPSVTNAGTLALSATGANITTFSTNSSERMRIDSSGNVGIGTTSLTGYSLRIAKNPTGATTTYGVSLEGTVQSDVTGAYYGYFSAPATAAAAFTLSSIRHFEAFQSTIGSTSAVTNQYGFLAGATLTGATNNYGFYSNIASGSNRYNFYANGTAENYFSGNVGIGALAGSTTGQLRISGNGTGATSFNGISIETSVQSDVTSGWRGVLVRPTTQATAFTLSNLYGIYINPQTFGAGSTVTNQYGVHVESTLTGATNNYGFYSNIASGSNRYNFYANGTADNYFAGNVGIGTTSPTAKLDVSSDVLRLRTAKTPASASATGNAGDICWDSSYIYVCTATNTWKRVAIATW